MVVQQEESKRGHTSHWPSGPLVVVCCGCNIAPPSQSGKHGSTMWFEYKCLQRLTCFTVDEGWHCLGRLCCGAFRRQTIMAGSESQDRPWGFIDAPTLSPSWLGKQQSLVSLTLLPRPPSWKELHPASCTLSGLLLGFGHSSEESSSWTYHSALFPSPG